MWVMRALPLLLVAFIALGCTTTAPRPPRSEFEDIPLPKGLAYVPEKSTVIESPSVKAARLVYRGRLEPESLGHAIRATLETQGWRHVSSTSTGGRGTIQVYEKESNALQIHVYEGLWYTYVEMDATRGTPVPGAAPKEKQ
jgi:hypothetical protein